MHNFFVVVVGFEHKMSKLSLPLSSFKHSEPFPGIALPLNGFVFSDYSFQLHQLQPAHPVKGPHERINPLVISQYPVDYAATAGDDLHRYPNQPIEKPTKLHCQKLIPMLPFAHQQSEPCFQRPGQRGHHHIGPVGYQIVHRHPQSLETILELLNEVFLVAPLIAEPHHFGRTQVRSVGNVEKVPNIVPQPHLAFFHRKALSQHNDPIGAFAFGRLIAEFGNMFAQQTEVSIPFLNNNLFFKIPRSLTPLCAQVFFLATPQHSPALIIKAFSDLNEVGHRVHSKRKTHSLRIPTVKMSSQSKIRISPQTDPLKTLPHQSNRAVNPGNGTVMGNTVARTIDQIQRLRRVGQGDQKRVVTPIPIVRKPDPFLTLPERQGVRPVRVNDRFLAFSPAQALLPQLGPKAVDRLHQLNHIPFRKPPREITSSGRVRNALNSHTVHKGFIVAPQFNILKTRSARKRVVRDVQNMVRLVIGQVSFQKVHLLVNGLHKTTVAGKQVKGSDPTTSNRTHPLGHFIVNILCSQQRNRLFRPLFALKALSQIFFTQIQYFGIFIFHSKCSSLRLVLFSQKSILTNNDGHFECFFFSRLKNHAYLKPRATTLSAPTVR